MSMASRDLEKGLAPTITEEVHDSIQPLSKVKKTTWGTVARTDTLGSNASSRSFLLKPVDLLRRFASPSSVMTSSLDWKERREFVALLIGEHKNEGTLKTASDWYATFLEYKISVFWETEIQRVILNLDDTITIPNFANFGVVYTVLTKMGEQLSSSKDLALARVVQDLLNDELLRDSGNRNEQNVTVFTLFGWLTLLYDPRKAGKETDLSVSKEIRRSDGSNVRLQSLTFDAYEQDHEYVDLPLYTMLGRFGRLIPDPSPRRKYDIAPPSEWIVGPLVCYQTLRNVCQIEILWTEALSEHLDFDSKRKKLKLFRYPGFCRLHYRSKERTVLSQLFEDNARSAEGDYTTDNSSMTSDFFQELLVTYRLIFGQDTKSWKLFRHEMHKLSTARRPSILTRPDADPFLEMLCGQDCNAPDPAAIYEDINAGHAQLYYIPSSFPYFGKKIMDVQGYVKQQHPNDWKTLWYDHRNKQGWWTFWAVLFIGGGTILLMLLSLLLQAWQVVLAKQQLEQGAN